MAIKVKELTKSREQTDTWIEIKLWARATGADMENDTTVKAAFGAFMTAMCTDVPGIGWTYAGLVYQDYHLEHAGGGIWFAEYRFGVQQFAFIEQGQSEFSFEISERGSRHITQALAHIASYPATPALWQSGRTYHVGEAVTSGGAPYTCIQEHQAAAGNTPPNGTYWEAGVTANNYGGLIGYDPQSGTVAGCDVPDSSFAFSVTWSPPLGTLTSAYITTLYKMRNRMNSAAWSVRADNGVILTFAPHEVLWRGFGGRKRTADGWGLVYQFEANGNLTNQTVGGISGINKDAWDYIWFEYDWREEANALAKTAVAAHVERVLHEFDFSYFQLPNV